MNTLSVSTFSLRERFGTLSFTFTDAGGVERTFSQEHPQELRLSEFPRRAHDEWGVKAVETVAFQFAGIDDPELDEFAAQARVVGVKLLNLAVDEGDLLHLDDDRRAADLAKLKRWIDRAAALGFERVRVNSGSPFSPSHGEVPPDHLVQALMELGQHANAAGVRLLVENHGGPSSDPAWMNALLERVGVDHLGLLLDLGNFDALMGPMMAALFAPPGSAPADPFAGLDLSSLYDGIEQLAPRAELVHVKAHQVTDDGQVGPVDLARALGMVLEGGSGLPLTIEYEGVGGDPWAKTGRVLQQTVALTG